MQAKSWLQRQDSMTISTADGAFDVLAEGFPIAQTLLFWHQSILERWKDKLSKSEQIVFQYCTCKTATL
jgi:hypothetical protein